MNHVGAAGENYVVMNVLQKAKKTVRSYHNYLDSMGISGNFDTDQSLLGRELRWLGVHPFGIIEGHRSVVERFWIPLKDALTCFQRREEIFFAGLNEIDDFKSVWVVSMGHMSGLFDKPWLGIPPTGKLAGLRYCTFHKVEDERITESVMHVDIPHLMAQAGINPFPSQTASTIMHNGPLTCDGLLLLPQPEHAGEKTLAGINGMINNLGTWSSNLPLEEELALNWHEDMTWWGPHGIGSVRTI